jgi:hypothetical protein
MFETYFRGIATGVTEADPASQWRSGVALAILKILSVLEALRYVADRLGLRSSQGMGSPATFELKNLDFVS